MHEGEPIAQFEIGPYRNFVYLLLDWETRKAAIVDPQNELEAPLTALERHGFSLERILLTHTHHDHVAGVPALLRALPGLSLALGELDLPRLPEELVRETRARGRLKILRDGDPAGIGRLEVTALHTPGHSAGEFCYRVHAVPGYLLTGDTLFIRDCGRTDLHSGDTCQMFESLQAIKRLPAGTVILPGHHYAPECASTLEKELRESPPLQCRNAEELESLP